jgi:hypothetical protein
LFQNKAGIELHQFSRVVRKQDRQPIGFALDTELIEADLGVGAALELLVYIWRIRLVQPRLDEVDAEDQADIEQVWPRAGRHRRRQLLLVLAQCR